MYLSEINLAYENCEDFNIDGRHIKGIFMDGIKESIVGFSDAKVEIRKDIDTLVLFISKDANKKRSSSDPYGNEFNRVVSGNDVTYISITLASYDEGKTITQEYAVAYEDDEKPCNSWQKAVIGKDGDMCLVISKDKNIDDYFHIDDDGDIYDFHI